MVWSWDVALDRAQPGCTVLETVSARGFRSAVWQWPPDSAQIPEAVDGLGSEVVSTRKHANDHLYPSSRRQGTARHRKGRPTGRPFLRLGWRRLGGRGRLRAAARGLGCRI